jgi:murein L,D-transpeptidase YcbB/YkuD
MRRRWFYIITIILSISFAGSDALAAKKSRGGKKTSTSRAKKETRGKATRGQVAKHARLTKAPPGRETRRLSRRERRELARSARSDKERYVVRGRNGRRHVRYRASRQNDAETPSPPSAPRPAGGISPERVTEIQHALMKAGYLQGEATGQYDESTVQAMKQFQEASGLRASGTPTAATLKKLGVSKRSNDGYAVPVTSVSESEKKRPQQTP